MHFRRRVKFNNFKTTERRQSNMASEVSTAAPGLEFEEPILAIEGKIRELERLGPASEETEESLRQLRRQWTDETRRC